MQASMAARAIGSIFIPILNAVLPYAIAAAQAIRMVASAIASLFGFSMPEIDYSGVSVAAAGAAELADSANDAAGGLGKAAKAAKELKNAALGIDELNVISPPEDNAAGGGGSGGAGGVGGGDGFDFPLPEYDFLGDAVAGRVEEIMNKLKPIIEWVQDHMEEIATVVEGIAVGLLAWKLATGFMNELGALRDVLKAIAGLFTFGPMTEQTKKLSDALRMFGSAALFAVAGVAEVDLIKRTFEAFKDGEAINWTDLIKFTADYAAVLGSLWGAFKLLGLGNIGLVLGTIVGGIPLLAAAFDDMFQNGLTPQNVALVGVFAVSLGAVAAVMGPLPAIAAGVISVLGGLALAMSQDAVPQVEIFDDTISAATREAVEPFVTSIRELQDSISELEFNPELITADRINDIRGKAANIKEAILNELDSDRNKELAKLNDRRNLMSDEMFALVEASINDKYDKAAQAVITGNDRINQLLEQAGTGDAETVRAAMAEIQSIILEQQEQGVQAFSETSAEAERILTNLKNASNRITAEQASVAIQNAIKARNETIQAAKEQYHDIVEYANGLREAGLVNQTEYDEMIRLAETARDDTIQAARKQYNEIVSVAKEKLGENSEALNYFTGEMNTRWEEHWQKKVADQNTYFDEIQENLGKDYDEMEDIENERHRILSEGYAHWWDDLKTAAGTGFDNIQNAIHEKWTAFNDLAGTAFDSFVTGVGTWWDGIKQKVSTKWEEVKAWFEQNVSPKLTASYWADKLRGIGEGIETAFRNGVNAAIRVLNGFITSFNNKLNFKVPSIDIPGLGTVGGQTISFGSIPTIPTFAQGGYPPNGELFIANEAGPELIGQIGRQTAVANSSQIEDAITLGVSKANDRVASLLYQLIQEVRQKDMSVVVGDDRIGRANDRYQRIRGVKVNTGAFADSY